MSSTDKRVHEWAENLINEDYLKTFKKNKSSKIPSPPGFKNLTLEKKQSPVVDGKDIKDFQLQRSWETAIQPAKAIPMNMFMSYMSGTSLQIIPIMTALMLLTGPIKSIISVKSAFKPILGYRNGIEQQDIMGHMFVYIAFQLVLMSIGLYKLYSMGLFPTTTSDWVSWESKIKVVDSIKAFSF